MINIAKLIDGFRSFKATKFSVQSDIIRHQLDQGQKPSTMVISCCDLPISPSEIFSTNPGELFVINNIGGFVPKFNTEGINGIMSAFDYALLNLEVENIIILGNTKSISASMIMSEDFIAEKNGEKKYIQVALSIHEKQTLEREFGNLLAIKDNYPKIVITMESFSGNTVEGIEIVELENFLLTN